MDLQCSPQCSIAVRWGIARIALRISQLSRISTGDSPTFTVSCTQREGHRKGHCANRLHHCWPLACTDASLYCLTFDLSPFLASLSSFLASLFSFPESQFLSSLSHSGLSLPDSLAPFHCTLATNSRGCRRIQNRTVAASSACI